MKQIYNGSVNYNTLPATKILDMYQSKKCKYMNKFINQCCHQVKVHTGSVTSVCVTPDGKYVVTGSEGGIIQIKRFDNNKLVREVGNDRHMVDRDMVDMVRVTPDGRYIVWLSNGSVYITRITDGKTLDTYWVDSEKRKGKLTNTNGDVYDGEWKNGLRHGKGIMTYKESGECMTANGKTIKNGVKL